MSERISSLIDGELSTEGEVDRVLQELGEGSAERTQWDAYHLIGDVLRATHGSGIPRDEFAKRLAAEPTVLAPRRTRSAGRDVSAWPMRIAAGVAAIAFVGWVAGSLFDSPVSSSPLAGSVVRTVSTTSSGMPAANQPGSVAPAASHSIQLAPMTSVSSQMAGPRMESSMPAQAPAAVAVGTNAVLDDYVWAHQRYSPASLMHDVAPYVRLISARGTGQ
jgi:Anti sigma-E protein RseA, N-terminal domain